VFCAGGGKQDSVLCRCGLFVHLVCGCFAFCAGANGKAGHSDLMLAKIISKLRPRMRF